MLSQNDQERYSVYVVANLLNIFHITTLFNKNNLPNKKHPKNHQKNPPQKHTEKYNNPLPNLNILYSNLQATFTLPSKHPLKYNKPP